MRVKEWLKRRKATRDCSDKLRISPWKPFSLSPPALGGLIGFTALLLAIVEASRQISNQNGGILFADDLDDLPASQKFAYLYLPTIIAVIYSIAWAWVDLDVKRMEPYYQLSRAEGAMASDSLELSYPHDFLPFVPVKALRRRHWAVVYSSTVMLLLFWGITPFQNAVIGQTILTQRQDVTYTRTSGLIPLQEQPKALSAEFFYTAYNIAVLKFQPPPFMTLTAAYDAARPETSEHHNNETWTFPSKQYSATLECVSGIPQGNITISDGRGCSYNLRNHEWDAFHYSSQPPYGPAFLAASAGQASLLQDGTFLVLDNVLEFNGQCTKRGRQIFALLWARKALENGTGPTITTLFCSPKYLFYDADITVTSEGIISSSSRTSTAQDIPSATFNFSLFEEVLSTGEVLHGSMNTNLPVNTRSIVRRAYIMEFGSLPTYGLALGPANYTEYLNQSVLQQTFEAAYNLLFISAFHSLNSHPTGNETIKGTMTSQQQAITIVQSFALILETFFSLMIVLGLLLLHNCWRREMNLKTDPSSLAHTMSIISESTSLLQVVASQRDVEQMEHGLKNHRFGLSRWTRGAPYRLDRSRPDEDAINLVARGQGISLRRTKLAINSSVEFSTVLGYFFCVFIMVVLGILTFLWTHSQNDQGLPPVSSNTVVFQLLFSYLPSATATFMDPIWTMLNRYLCTCQSLIELQQRPTAASQSLSTKYTSLPPALTLGKAFRSGHMLLALVCGMTLSINLLAVAFSSLFNPDFRSVTVPSNFTLKHEPYLEAGFAHGPWTTEPEIFYIAKSYLSDNGSLPPWVSPEFFFAPFEMNVQDSTDATQYRAETVGFQASLSCEEVIQGDAFNLSLWVENSNTPPGGTVTEHLFLHGPNISIQDQSGNLSRCGNLDGSITTLLVYGNGTTTGENIHPLIPSDNSISDPPFTCAKTLLFSWFRANTSTSSNTQFLDESNSSMVTYNYTMLACRQRLTAHTINVTVNAKGLIQNYDQPGTINQVSALPKAPEKLDNLTVILGLKVVQSLSLHQTNPAKSFAFHNDGNAKDWFSYLMAIHTKSSDFLNPHLPVPNPSTMAARVNTTYQMLVAILLGQHYATDDLLALRPDNSTSIQGTITYRTKRVAVSTPMFIISAVVLSLNLIVGIAYFIYTGRNKLPWAPYSLMDTIAYFTNTDNDALVDVQRTATMSTRQRDAFLREKGSLYGLGKVVDERGKERWVIDRAEKVFRGEFGHEAAGRGIEVSQAGPDPSGMDRVT